MRVRITANQVTFARLVAIPFLSACLYLGSVGRTIALILGVVIGLTDFVDGYLARKYGPTVLGGLMDPIADKVFVVTGLTPMAALGWVPWWLIYAILGREFLVTALRSSFELRRQTLRSTYLAKIKTWVQMLALAVTLALAVIPHSGMVVLFLAIPALALAAGAGARLLGRRWRGVWIFFGIWGVAAAVYLGLGLESFQLITYAGVIAITWISALDYLSAAWRALAPLRAFDVARLIGATALPTAAILDLQYGALLWAVVALLAIEVAHGGLDNLLAHEQVAAPAWAWAGRVLGATALLGAALLIPPRADLLVLGALTITLAGTVAEFWRNRRHYLEPKAAPKVAPAQA